MSEVSGSVRVKGVSEGLSERNSIVLAQKMCQYIAFESCAVEHVTHFYFGSVADWTVNSSW